MLVRVPMEGHWKRVNTPLRETTARERLLVRGLLAVLAAAALAALVVLIATSGGSSGSSDCVDVDVPSTMGGSAIHACGSDARTFCSGPLAHSADLRARALPECRDAGFALGSNQP
jgi:hypothetical protein